MAINIATFIYSLECDKIVIKKTNFKIMPGGFNETGNNKIRIRSIIKSK